MAASLLFTSTRAQLFLRFFRNEIPRIEGRTRVYLSTLVVDKMKASCCTKFSTCCLDYAFHFFFFFRRNSSIYKFGRGRGRGGKEGYIVERILRVGVEKRAWRERVCIILIWFAKGFYRYFISMDYYLDNVFVLEGLLLELYNLFEDIYFFFNKHR